MNLPTIGRAIARISISCLATALLCGCGGDSGERQAEPPAAGSETPLPARVVYSGDSLAAPLAVAWAGGRLVVLDPMGDSVVKVLDPASGRLVRSFGRRGKGPGEFAGAWSLDVPEAGSGRFWIYDFELRRFTHVDLGADFQPGARPGRRMVHLASDFTVNWPVHLRDGSIASPGFLARPGRLARFDSAGTLTGIVGSSPPGREGVPGQIAQHAYQSTARANPEGTLIVLATRHADRLEIYRPDGTLVALARGPDRFEPVYTVEVTGGHPTLATSDDLRFGYVGLATTADRIYALYSGKTRGEAPGVASRGRAVHVFDWSGRLRGTWPLDSSVMGVATDPAGRTLYAVRNDPEPAVVAYTIPEEARE